MELGLTGRSALITGAGDGMAPAGGYRLLLDGALGLDFDDPAVAARIREAQIHPLTRVVSPRS